MHYYLYSVELNRIKEYVKTTDSPNYQFKFHLSLLRKEKIYYKTNGTHITEIICQADSQAKATAAVTKFLDDIK